MLALQAADDRILKLESAMLQQHKMIRFLAEKEGFQPSRSSSRSPTKGDDDPVFNLGLGEEKGASDSPLPAGVSENFAKAWSSVHKLERQKAFNEKAGDSKTADEKDGASPRPRRSSEKLPERKGSDPEEPMRRMKTLL
jgi:hypothetical protein